MEATAAAATTAASSATIEGAIVTAVSLPYPRFLLTQLHSTNSPLQYSMLCFVLYMIEFSRIALGPILFKVVAILFKLLLSPLENAWNSLPSIDVGDKKPEEGRGREGLKFSATSEMSATLIEDDSNAAVDLNAVNYKAAKEDRRSAKGDKRDIERLRKMGYNKYRFVSQGFIRRNKLTNTISSERSEFKIEDESEDGQNVKESTQVEVHENSSTKRNRKLRRRKELDKTATKEEQFDSNSNIDD